MGVYQNSGFDFLSKYAGAAAARNARAQQAASELEKGTAGLSESAASLIAYKKRNDAIGDDADQNIDEKLSALKTELAIVNAQIKAMDDSADGVNVQSNGSVVDDTAYTG